MSDDQQFTVSDDHEERHRFVGRSKSFWCAILLVVLSSVSENQDAVLAFLAKYPHVAPWVGVAFGVAFVVLRLLTNSPVTVRPFPRNPKRHGES